MKHFPLLFVKVITRDGGVLKNFSRIVQKLMVVAVIFILVVGCSSPKESDTDMKTIQTFLEIEFTGPNEELTNALEQDGLFPPELEEYLEENYQPLVMNLEDMMNKNHILLFLRFAYGNGYHLQPTNIDIQKVQDNAYDYEVKVEYSKDDQLNTATITARINLNDEGKIVTIRNMDDDGLLEMMRQ